MVVRHFASGGIHPCDEGEWVSYDDYAALEARLAELEGKLSDAESDIDTIAEHNIELYGKAAELEKDAARYRWIRKNCDSLETPDFTLQGWIFVNNGCTKLDCLVDEHLSREA